MHTGTDKTHRIPQLIQGYGFIEKTVLRAGFGIVYTGTPQNAGRPPAGNTSGASDSSVRLVNYNYLSRALNKKSLRQDS